MGAYGLVGLVCLVMKTGVNAVRTGAIRRIWWRYDYGISRLGVDLVGSVRAGSDLYGLLGSGVYLLSAYRD